jgi:hypothetical protein
MVNGIGKIDTEAIILPDLEKSGYDIIVGFPLIRKYNLTRVFEEMFTEQTEETSGPVPTLEELSDAGAPPPVSPKRDELTTSFDKIPASDSLSRENTLNTDTEDLVLSSRYTSDELVHTQVLEDSPIISRTTTLNVMIP